MHAVSATGFATFLIFTFETIPNTLTNYEKQD
jgi:hypothetical protein